VIEAADRGELILSQRDPRALKEYDAQLDMKGLAAGYELATAATKGVKEVPQAAVDKTSDFFGKVDSSARGLASRWEGLKESIKTALDKETGSAMFVFTEKELRQGEAFADKLDPSLVSAVQSTMEFGPQAELSPERHEAMMASVNQFDKEHQERESARDPQREETQTAQVERRRDEGEQEAAQEREAELDMDA
jgi:hypothetical protein